MFLKIVAFEALQLPARFASRKYRPADMHHDYVNEAAWRCFGKARYALRAAVRGRREWLPVSSFA
jgi:hypothetical protein